MTDKRRKTTSAAVKAIARANPGMTLEEIGRQAGVTRERVRQIIPAWGKCAINVRADRDREAAARLLAPFIEQHPEAVLPIRDGGWAKKKIAEEIGWEGSAYRLDAAWQALGLPDRRALSEADDPYSLDRIVGWWACSNCGKAFPVTYQKTLNWRHAVVKYRVCGTKCGNALRGKPADNPYWTEEKRERRNAYGRKRYAPRRSA